MEILKNIVINKPVSNPVSNSVMKILSTTDSGSMPEVIELTQFNVNWFNNKINATETIKSNVSARRFKTLGNLGNGYMDTCIDFTCAPIALGSDDDPFKDINNLILNSKMIRFSKKFFLENYIVIEIPDYGSQTMTLNYTDFVPQIWINKQKLWQKYIGIIRYYSRKTVWIIIKKENNLSNNLDINEKEIDIRILFKNNIESSDLKEKDSRIEIKLKKESETPDENGMYTYIENSSHVFSENGIRDYDLYLNNEKVDYDKYFFELKIYDNSKKVSCQNIYDNVSSSPKEYFRQSFINDYTDYSLENKNNEFYIKRETKRIELKTSINANLFILKPRNDCFNAIYKKYSESREYINDNEKYMCFNKYGNLISEFYENDEMIEIVPESTAKRRYCFLIENNGEIKNYSFAQILYDNFIFPYNITNTEYLKFDVDGKLNDAGNKSSIDIESDQRYTIFVYESSNFSEETIQSVSGLSYFNTGEKFNKEQYKLDPFIINDNNGESTNNDNSIIIPYYFKTNEKRKIRFDTNELIIDKYGNLNITGLNGNVFKNNTLSLNDINGEVIADSDNFKILKKNILTMFIKSNYKEEISQIKKDSIIIVENDQPSINEDKYIYFTYNEKNIISYFEVADTLKYNEKEYAIIFTVNDGTHHEVILNGKKSKDLKIYKL